MSKCVCFVIFLYTWTAAQASHPFGADVCRQRGTTDVSNSEMLNVTSFYSSKSRSININITTDNISHSCINVVHNKNKESSSEECDPHYFYSYFAESSDLKFTVLPEGHANTHEFLQPGCSYEIYVRDESGNYAQEEFTVPECFEQLCNCKHLHPNLEIGKIEQTGPSQLLVNWKELKSDVNPAANIQKRIFWTENKNGTRIRCEDNETDAGSTSLNCSRNFAAENYTLNAGFRDNYGCRGKAQVQFLGTDMTSTEEVITNTLSLLKQSDGRITQVVTVYNADHTILQLNISWSDFTEQEYVISLKSEDEDLSNRCYVDTAKLKENATNVLLPEADENYTLLPGCSYKISLRTSDYAETIQYSVPSCLENYLSQLETPPSLTTNVNSEFAFVEAFYEQNLENLAAVTASVLTSDFSYICDCAPLKSSANTLTFRCNNRLQSEPDYVISFVLVDEEQECHVTYLRTFYPGFSKRLSRSAATNNGEILLLEDEERSTTTSPINKTINVQAYYNEIHDVIQLNVTFSVPANRKDEFTHFHIAALSNDKTNSCDSNYIYETAINVGHVNSSLISVKLPIQPASKSEEIQGGCGYEIRVQDSEKLAYRVPVCVGPICNFCSNSTPQVDLKNAEVMSPNTLKITWMFESREYNISNLEFKYRRNETTHTPEPCRILDSTHDTNITDEIYSTVQCDRLVNGTNYVLLATVTNNFTCTRVASKNFTAIWFKTPEESYHHLWIEIPAFLAILTLVSATLFYKRRVLLEKFKRSSTRIESCEIYERPAVGETRKAQECYNIIYCESEIVTGNMDKYEIPRTKVKIIKLLDSGAFGQVFSAQIIGTVDKKPLPPVAVKTLRDHAPPDELEDFLSEIEILKRIGEHPNIVKLIGCCTLKQPYMMVMELVPCGSLKSYLLKLRKRWDNYKSANDSVFSDSTDGDYIQPDSPSSRGSSIPFHKLPSLTETEYTNVESEGHTPLLNNFNYSLEPVLDHTELQNFALQIAKGMAYLEEKQITHRDLAARNVLINEFKTLKISDFGLSRVGPYINSKTKKLPLRWMSIEAIEDHFYNNKSDVWSFGIVLWEIGSLGAIPYEYTPDALILHDLLIGKRLEKPGICTEELYKLMLRCWSHDPNQRPTFAELEDQLEVKKTRIYVDFSQLNPTYVFPPATLEKMTNSQVVIER